MFTHSALLAPTVQRLDLAVRTFICHVHFHLTRGHIVLGVFGLYLLDVLRSSATPHHALQVYCRRPLNPSSSPLQTIPDRSIINPSRHVLNQLANEWKCLHYFCLEGSCLISAEGKDAASPRALLWGLFRSTGTTAALPFHWVTTFLEMQIWVWTSGFRVHFYQMLTFLEQTWLRRHSNATQVYSGVFKGTSSS